MSGCDLFRDRVQEDLDGRLTPADRAALESHLATCAECAQLAARLRRVRAGIRAMDDVPAPPGFREDVLARLPARGRLVRLPWFVGGLAAAAALVVAVVVIQADRASAPELSAWAPANRESSEFLDGETVAKKARGAKKERVAEKALADDSDLAGAPPAGVPAAETPPPEIEKEESRTGPAGEIPPDSRRPADSPPPPKGPVPGAGAPAADAPAEAKKPGAPGPAAPPATDPAAAELRAQASPRVRLVVFRTREAADRFVEAFAASAVEESERAGADLADDKAGGKAKDDAPKRDAERRAEDADSALRLGATAGAYAEIARMGLPDEASLARARTAAAANGGLLSDALDVSLDHDALVPESVARAVADEVEGRARGAGGPAAGEGGPTEGGPTTGGGAGGVPRIGGDAGGGDAGGAAPGFTAPGEPDTGARKEAPKDRAKSARGDAGKEPGRRSAEDGRARSNDAPPAPTVPGAPAKEEAPPAEILVVVVVPEPDPARFGPR